MLALLAGRRRLTLLIRRRLLALGTLLILWALFARLRLVSLAFGFLVAFAVLGLVTWTLLCFAAWVPTRMTT